MHIAVILCIVHYETRFRVCMSEVHKCLYIYIYTLLKTGGQAKVLDLCGTSSFKIGLLKRLRPPRSSCVSLQHGRLVLILDTHKVFESVCCVVIVISASPRQFDARCTTIDALI